MNPASPPGRPLRTDLPYLRRRYRRVAVAEASPTPSRTRSELDLTVPASAAPQPDARAVGPAYVPARTRPGIRTILTRQMPTVTLTRIQSGLAS